MMTNKYILYRLECYKHKTTGELSLFSGPDLEKTVTDYELNPAQIKAYEFIKGRHPKLSRLGIIYNHVYSRDYGSIDDDLKPLNQSLWWLYQAGILDHTQIGLKWHEFIWTFVQKIKPPEKLVEVID